MMDRSVQKSIYAIVLAAGSATRFGALKQLATWHGEALVCHATRTASAACPAHSLLVTGPEWNRVRLACEPFDGFFAINERHAQGLGSSLALAVRCLAHAADALIVLLADQPLVRETHIARLLEQWPGGANDIVASAYADTAGVPALFGSGCFDRLAALSGDSGARDLLDSDDFNVRTIRFENAHADIDTLDDLVRLSRNARS